MVLLIIAITLGNVVSLVIFLGSKRFWTPQGYLKASLALADIAVGVLVIPYSVHREIQVVLQGEDYNQDQSEEVWRFHPCHVIGPIFAGCTFVSITTIFLLSIERSITVLRPLHKNIVVTKKRTLGLILFSWLLCFFLALVPLLFSRDITLEYNPCSRMCNYAFSPPHQSSDLNILLLFPAFDFSLLGGTLVINLITFSAIRQFCNIRKRLAESETQRISNSPSFSDIRAAKTIVILTLSFSVSFGPVAVFVLGSVLGYQWCDFSFYAFWILTSNSCWNVVIYSVRDRSFRRRTRELFSGKVLKDRRPSVWTERRHTTHCVAVIKDILRPQHTNSAGPAFEIF
ncbi:adenosine receptor A2a-like [Amia ocellicauda]|uniref:adenosine receptor A2a-like n=1 Tax=Amia ocellicauda TaxID=2972642 RepID=UPI0034647435